MYSNLDWTLVENGKWKGVTILVDNETGHIVKLTTRSCRDAERWKVDMPELDKEFATLRLLDLHKSRYLKQLHNSVGTLHNLRSLVLTRCDGLINLPESICDLQNLQEVNMSFL